jgi:hypothetical protein
MSPKILATPTALLLIQLTTGLLLSLLMSFSAATPAEAWTRYNAHRGKPLYVQCANWWPAYHKRHGYIDLRTYMNRCERGLTIGSRVK